MLTNISAICDAYGSEYSDVLSELCNTACGNDRLGSLCCSIGSGSGSILAVEAGEGYFVGNWIVTFGEPESWEGKGNEVFDYCGGAESRRKAGENLKQYFFPDLYRL